jgi:molecular chaperone Hsp33
VHLDSAWRAVLERHDYPPAVRNLLGELMAAAVLLSAMLKFNGSMILQIQGNGPVNLLVVESTSERTLRGMAQWAANWPDAIPSLSDRKICSHRPKGRGQRYQARQYQGETVSQHWKTIWRAPSRSIAVCGWQPIPSRRRACFCKKCLLAKVRMPTCGSAPHTSAPP